MYADLELENRLHGRRKPPRLFLKSTVRLYQVHAYTLLLLPSLTFRLHFSIEP